ncbi:MAG: antitoxin [Circular genetic element sp.]|nr:MAG: antitoxin [Circular genetic element sp.]
MRINRTFSIPIDLAQDLKKKHNQSETVTRALRKYLDPDQEIYAADFDTRSLCIALKSKEDIDDTLKALLLQILSK